MSHYQLVAHRGYPQHYPENTLIGIMAAIKAGARFVEVDIQLSKDKAPVLFHDRDMLRLCGKQGSLHDFTARQLTEYHVVQADKFGQQFQHIPIAPLSELVELIGENHSVTFFIELKRISIEHFGAETVVDIVLPHLQSVQQQTAIISYSLEALKLVRQQYDLPIGVIIDDWKDHTQTGISELHPEYLFFDIETLPPQQPVRFGNSKLVVFECTDPEQAKRVAQQGVALVETFAIGEMLRALQE